MSYEQRLKQLEERLSHWRQVKELSMPEGGWVKAIRSALGLTTRKLAQKANLSQSRVVHIEKNEIEGNLTLDSLRGMAEAMDCELVYALVPKRTLEYTIKKQIGRLAQKRVKEKLESMSQVVIQGKSQQEQKEQAFLAEVAAIANAPYKQIWQDD